jgi:CheY-like chemotaxis protein
MPAPKDSAASIRTAAQRALFRILETTIPDRAISDRAVSLALVEANLTDVPEEFDQLLPFVRQFLALHLDDADRPWLLTSVIEDLEAEAEVARLGDSSSARMAIATRIPERMPTERAPGSDDHADEEDEPAPSVEIEVVPSVPRAPSVPRIPLRATRPSVLVVDGDRFKRSALARALVQGRCDVTVLDGGDEALAVVFSTDPIDVLVIDPDAPGSVRLLDALVAERPETPVLAWTNSPAAVAEHVARVAGVRACAVVPRNALNNELHETLTRLLEGC